MLCGDSCNVNEISKLKKVWFLIDDHIKAKKRSQSIFLRQLLDQKLCFTNSFISYVEQYFESLDVPFIMAVGHWYLFDLKAVTFLFYPGWGFKEVFLCFGIFLMMNETLSRITSFRCCSEVLLSQRMSPSCHLCERAAPNNSTHLFNPGGFRLNLTRRCVVCLKLADHKPDEGWTPWTNSRTSPGHMFLCRWSRHSAAAPKKFLSL